MTLTNEYIVGLIEGEGCFCSIVRTRKLKRTRDYRLVKPRPSSVNYKISDFVFSFTINLHIRDTELLKSIQLYTKLGTVRKYPYIVQWTLQSIKERQGLITFIDSTSGLKGYKGIQYDKWKSLQEKDREDLQILYNSTPEIFNAREIKGSLDKINSVMV